MFNQSWGIEHAHDRHLTSKVCCVSNTISMLYCTVSRQHYLMHLIRQMAENPSLPMMLCVYDLIDPSRSSILLCSLLVFCFTSSYMLLAFNVLSSSPRKHLDYTIAASTDHPTPVLTPHNRDDTLSSHQAVGRDLLGAASCFKRPEP
jgi:hypothetical protein